MEENRLEPAADSLAEDSLRPEVKGTARTRFGPEAGSHRQSPLGDQEDGPPALVAGRPVGWGCTRQPSIELDLVKLVCRSLVSYV